MKDQQPTSGITDWGQTPLRVASVPFDTSAPLQQLAAQLSAEPMELVLLFISPDADVQALARDVPVAFGQTPVIGCTTAGELTDAGYAEGQIVAIGLPKSLFCTRTQLIENLSDVDTDALVRRMLRNRDALRREAEAFRHEFNFLIVDGLSQREDALTAALSLGLGPVPLFGGSAGDGADFGAAFVLWQGQLYRNAAVLTQIRSRCPVRVFKSDHLVPSGRKMVVTSARPQERLVQEINAEPAAREYARLLGKDPEQLDTFTFAAHPVVVQIGDQHHVRSIQRVAENGDLVFFSAIDEGVVLTLADSLHMVDHLEAQFADLSRDGVPEAILACDCLLRKLEAEQKQMIGQLSEVMVQNRVVGFSTYGEQLNSMHVNQTLTGVAFYPPDPLNDTAEEDLA